MAMGGKMKLAAWCRQHDTPFQRFNFVTQPNMRTGGYDTKLTDKNTDYFTHAHRLTQSEAEDVAANAMLDHLNGGSGDDEDDNEFELVAAPRPATSSAATSTSSATTGRAQEQVQPQGPDSAVDQGIVWRAKSSASTRVVTYANEERPAESSSRLSGGGSSGSGSGGDAVAANAVFVGENKASATLVNLLRNFDENDKVVSFMRSSVSLDVARSLIHALLVQMVKRHAALRQFQLLLKTVLSAEAIQDVLWYFLSVLVDGQPSQTGPGDSVSLPLGRHPLAGLSASAALLQPLRASFHSLLAATLELMRRYPDHGPLLQTCLRCWYIGFDSRDHSFMHEHHVFSVISRVLKHFSQAESAPGTAQVEVTSRPDITKTARLTVSSREGMANSLTDNSTETFWETSDEDNAKGRSITLDFHGAADSPTELALFIDLVRDAGFPISRMTLMTGAAKDSLEKICETPVDEKYQGWVILNCEGRKRVELAQVAMGSAGKVRVRQVRAYGKPVPAAGALSSADINRTRAGEALKIFKELTVRVFGAQKADAKDESGDQSELKQHVVGLLFNQQSKSMSGLQSQVCHHIVNEVGKETERLRKLVLGATAPLPASEDAYSFELHSMLVALSGTADGADFLGKRIKLARDLVANLHFNTPRIQRQVVAILRRVLPSCDVRMWNNAFEAVPALRLEVGLVSQLLLVIAKSLELQLRSRTQERTVTTAKMSSVITPPADHAEYVQGSVSVEIAQEVIKLFAEILALPQAASESSAAAAAVASTSLSWTDCFKAAVKSSILELMNVEESVTSAQEMLAHPRVWLALAALAVVNGDMVQNITPVSAAEQQAPAGAEVCANHDDGVTMASVSCTECALKLCAECDRFLHLPRSKRNHTRVSSGPTGLRVELHEGCGRAKLARMLALVDRNSLKSIVEFRGASTAGTCRFCYGPLDESGGVAQFVAYGVQSCCGNAECIELAKLCCIQPKACEHRCYGVRDEKTCLPCLHGCDADKQLPLKLTQDHEDQCMICFTTSLAEEPCIQVDCGHVFHYRCIKRLLETKWNGPRITFGFCACPICSRSLLESKHPAIVGLTAPLLKLYLDVRKKALMRLSYDGLQDSVQGEEAQAKFAMKKYAYYVCFKCEKPYFGGLEACAEARASDDFDPAELVCAMCVGGAAAQMCPKHGADFLEYKCRYCCSVAVFFCFGTTHFCNTCHDAHSECVGASKDKLPHCPAAPVLKQLEGDECPLHIKHPPTGEEFALGCGVCRNAQTF
eukprot:m.208215 g.208215  ORF g.208215 m.208215 type:complete len:1259 (+) comp17798_c1_seq1:478-4254(+)